MLTKEEIRKTDISKLITNKKTEKADFKRLENKAFKKTENCITEIIKKIRKCNADESIKNKFFTEKIKIMNKKNL